MNKRNHTSKSITTVQVLPKGGPQSLLCVFERCTAAIRGTFRSRYRQASIGSLSELNADALVGTSTSTSEGAVLHGPAPSPSGSTNRDGK